MATARKVTAASTDPVVEPATTAPEAAVEPAPAEPAPPVLRVGGHINRRDGRGWVPEGVE